TTTIKHKIICHQYHHKECKCLTAQCDIHFQSITERSIDAHTSDPSDSLDLLDPSDSSVSALLYASKKRFMPHGYSSTCCLRFVRGKVYTCPLHRKCSMEGVYRQVVSTP